MKRLIRLLSTLLVFVLLIVSFSGCLEESSKKVVIGSKDFTESILVGELYALALEDAGVKVELQPALGGTPILHEAMIAGEIDIIGEYTSTGMTLVLKEEPEFDSEKCYQKVKEGYERDFDFTWLEKSAVNNSQGLAINKKISDELSFTKLSQLPEFASKIRMCATAEFEERDDGLKGLINKLGEIKYKSIRVYDKGLKYQILRQGEADMNVCFTTDSDLAKGDIIALEDDVSFWPSYNLAPVIRNETLKDNPEIENILNKVSAKLTTEIMQTLNAKVDIEGREYREVAKEALEEWGLIG